MCTIASSPLLLFDLSSHYFLTLVMSFGRLQLLCCNCELTVPFQMHTSSNIRGILLYSKICLLRHFSFNYFNFSIVFISTELTNVISPYNGIHYAFLFWLLCSVHNPKLSWSHVLTGSANRSLLEFNNLSYYQFWVTWDSVNRDVNFSCQSKGKFSICIVPNYEDTANH